MCVCVSLREANFPCGLLPEVLPAGSVAGYMQKDWHGIAQGTPVGAALGDMQCSILSRLSQPSDAG